MDFSTETITILRRGGDLCQTHFKTRLKCAKNLYLSHRFFYKIRQIHSFFNVFRQNLQILCRNQAPSRRPARRPPDARRARAALPPPGENPRPLAALTHKKPGIHTKWMPGRNRLQPVRALTCTRRSPYQQQRRSRPCQSSL